jgi:hypothetical protein
VRFFIALFLLTVEPNGYVERLEGERVERDEVFSDSLKSPLATVSIWRVDQAQLTFGSSRQADLVWNQPSIAPLHLRVYWAEGTVYLEPLEGPVRSVSSGERLVGRQQWEIDEYYQVGDKHLVLQLHPVGPVIRAIDSEATAFLEFSGLHYFPVEPSYRVRARIEPQERKRRVILDTQGWERESWHFGKLLFELHGEPQELALLLFDKNPSPNSRFLLMFRDTTSGKETYPACRYLSIPYQEEGETWVDFNLAFNPYCAYGDGFACPLPPYGNTISTAVRAGEKTYPRHPKSKETVK